MGLRRCCPSDSNGKPITPAREASDPVQAAPGERWPGEHVSAGAFPCHIAGTAQVTSYQHLAVKEAAAEQAPHPRAGPAQAAVDSAIDAPDSAQFQGLFLIFMPPSSARNRAYICGRNPPLVDVSPVTRLNTWPSGPSGKADWYPSGRVSTPPDLFRAK